VRSPKPSGRVSAPREKPAPESPVEEIEGVYTGNPKGFGFVRPAAHSPRRRSLRIHDVFIPQGATSSAIDGDRVRVKLGAKGTGKVLAVLERGRKALAGTYQEEGLFRPDAHSIPGVLTLTARTPSGGRAPRPGDKVIAVAEGSSFVLGEVLGRSGDPVVEDRAVLLEMGIAGEFPEEVEREAARFGEAKVAGRDRRGRIDLRDEPTVVTIDPLTAKDFDDAISLKPVREGGWVLGVHIADVSHYVAEGTALDREAQLRGSSAYLPMKVVPMLPHALSSGLCSLREGEDRLTMSVLLTYDARGTLRSARAARSVIRSSRRFTYERASRVMEGAGGETREVSQLLRDMHSLAAKLRDRRPSLAIHEPGVEFTYSASGEIVEVCTTEGDDAHWVIEEFMLAANREVAGWLLSLREPALFRHHPPPGGLDDLRDFLHGMGLSGARERPLPELMRRAEEAGLGAAATSFLMEAMEAAEYSPREPRHDALGFAHYAHFTSPIRRYADLTVHRAVARHLTAGRWAEMEARSGERPPAEPVSTPELERLAAHLNGRERAIAHAESRLRRRRILEFLQKKGNEPLQGVVLRALERGLLVNLPGYLISGFIAASSLGAGPRRSEPHKLTVGSRSFQPGQPLEVRISRIEPLRGELDLTPA
jgi:ribonuclease R